MSAGAVSLPADAARMGAREISITPGKISDSQGSARLKFNCCKIITIRFLIA
jgi:ribonuclease PH